MYVRNEAAKTGNLHKCIRCKQRVGGHLLLSMLRRLSVSARVARNPVAWREVSRVELDGSAAHRPLGYALLSTAGPNTLPPRPAHRSVRFCLILVSVRTPTAVPCAWLRIHSRQHVLARARARAALLVCCEMKLICHAPRTRRSHLRCAGAQHARALHVCPGGTSLPLAAGIRVSPQ